MIWIFCMTLAGWAQEPSFRWVRTSEGKGGFGDAARSVALDKEENCYVAGGLNSAKANFIDVKLTNEIHNGAFLNKYDRKGNLVWIRQPLGTNSEARGATTDAEGNCYVTGFYSRFTNKIAGITFSNSASNAAGSSVFAIKYNSTGEALWAVSAGDGAGYDRGEHVVVDTNNNLYLAGIFHCPVIEFGGSKLTNSVGKTNLESDFFLVKFDAAGKMVWAKRGGPIEPIFGLNLTSDRGGNIYMASSFQGRADFGGKVLFNKDCQICLAKFDSAGKGVWANQAGGEGHGDFGAGIAVDGAGCCYVTGTLNSTNTHFDKITLAPHFTNPVNFSYHFCIAKYDIHGTAMWAVAIGNGGMDMARGFALDREGNCFVSGGCSSAEVTFGPVTLENRKPGQAFGYIAKYNSEGNFQWVKKFGGESCESAQAVAVNSTGTIYVAGVQMSTNASFDGIKITRDQSACRMFVGRLDEEKR